MGGGFAKAQRSIPATLEICRYIEKIQPKCVVTELHQSVRHGDEAVLRHTKKNGWPM